MISDDVLKFQSGFISLKSNISIVLEQCFSLMSLGQNNMSKQKISMLNLSVYPRKWKNYSGQEKLCNKKNKNSSIIYSNLHDSVGFNSWKAWNYKFGIGE